MEFTHEEILDARTEAMIEAQEEYEEDFRDGNTDDQ